MVCDLGQTSLKISWSARRWIFPRDVLALPIKGGGECIQTKGENRRQLRKFIAECLRHVVEESNIGFPEKVVFALPSALDKFGQPAGSSYIGMKDDTQLVPDALELAGFSGGTIVLVNDAILVALSVLQDDRVIEFSQVLVITLGHAVGTVILDPLAFFAASDAIPG
jgi:hypothetical protein